MAYTNGTAANYKDLLAALATFAAANGWTVLEQSETTVYMKGEGSAGLDEIHVGIQAYENTSSDYYNWSLTGSVTYRAGRAWGNQPWTSGTNKAHVYLWNSSIPYWMVATPRRIIMIAKVSTVYQIMHIGLIEPPGTEAQYPYPLLIAGCGSVSSNRWSSTTDNSMFCSNYYQTGRLMVPGGEWLDVRPGTSLGYVNAVWSTMEFRGNVLAAPDGSYLLDQIWLTDGGRRTIYGMVDGLYNVSGHNNAAENIITVNGTNHLVFPDVYRSGFGEYFALRLT